MSKGGETVRSGHCSSLARKQVYLTLTGQLPLITDRTENRTIGWCISRWRQMLQHPVTVAQVENVSHSMWAMPDQVRSELYWAKVEIFKTKNFILIQHKRVFFFPSLLSLKWASADHLAVVIRSPCSNSLSSGRSRHLFSVKSSKSSLHQTARSWEKALLRKSDFFLNL